MDRRYDFDMLDDVAKKANPRRLLSNSFVWEYTIEGHNYWKDVADRLDALVENRYYTRPLPEISNKYLLISVETDLRFLNRLLEFIETEFEWALTHEGIFFWEEIFDRLEQKRIREGGFIEGIVKYLLTENTD